MKKIILVTGGAGFIGSHLCEKLVNQDNIVFSLDNYSTGSEENHIGGVEYIKGNTQEINAILNIKPDIVYHLGEYSRVEQSFGDLRIVWESNKIGTFEVLEFCRKNNTKLVYAGSSTKFGDGGLGRMQSPYAWTKASNTELIRNYGIWFGLPYAIVYFYNVYGGREISIGKYATLLGIFKRQYLENKPLTVVSPGNQKRNFTYIEDIINGLTLVGEEGYGDDFGIGNKDAYSILEIARMFGKEIEMLPPRAGNRMSADVMTEKTEKLGWKAIYSVEEYIKSIVKNTK